MTRSRWGCVDQAASWGGSERGGRRSRERPSPDHPCAKPGTLCAKPVRSGLAHSQDWSTPLRIGARIGAHHSADWSTRGGGYHDPGYPKERLRQRNKRKKGYSGEGKWGGVVSEATNSALVCTESSLRGRARRGGRQQGEGAGGEERGDRERRKREEQKEEVRPGRRRGRGEEKGGDAGENRGKGRNYKSDRQQHVQSGTQGGGGGRKSDLH